MQFSLSELPSWKEALQQLINDIKEKDILNSDPILLVYFSAKWCLPCQNMTSLLIEYYKTWNAESKVIEIIFVSRDKDEQDFNDYSGKMPWLKIPFKNKEMILDLRNYYKVQAIPTLILINAEGRSLNSNVREDIEMYGEQAIDHIKEIHEEYIENVKNWDEIVNEAIIIAFKKKHKNI